ncbi:glycosyltransferase family 4 protein [Phytohabitans sp. LJ34]|uniref:glycosyltransferase family 4 protein n=1 Tax=Phytohabitans sp. LJ34 TaxID=3452217 RepID=UPI003F894141
MTLSAPEKATPPTRDPGRPLRIGMIVVSEYESDPRVRRQAEALVARGDEVTVVALAAPGRPEIDVVDGVNVVHLPTRKYRGSSAKAYLSLYGGFGARAARWLSTRPRAFDLVQAHSMPEALVFAAVVPRLFGTPVLLDVHDLTSKLFASKFAGKSKVLGAITASEKASFRFAREVLTVHEPYADEIRACTKRPVSVVMNCPDERLFVPRPEPLRWDPAGEIVFSYHGLVAPRHGLVEATEALARLRGDFPGARLQVRGSGDGLEELGARAAALGVADAVDLPTKLYPLPEIVKELEKVHIGLVPSKLDPWTDGVLPTKLMEYAMLGVPVITFRNPVISRYFPDDTVRYVDPANPDTLHEAMRELAGDPDKALAQAARASEVMAGLRWSEQKKHYFAVVDRLAARRG